jgi:hypothetical protein
MYTTVDASTFPHNANTSQLQTVQIESDSIYSTVPGFQRGSKR